MDLTETRKTPPHDGWADARQVLFLNELAACSEVALSPEAAYQLRRCGAPARSGELRFLVQDPVHLVNFVAFGAVIPGRELTRLVASQQCG